MNGIGDRCALPATIPYSCVTCQLAKYAQRIVTTKNKVRSENLGRSCSEAIIRGGTDGSQLTEKGLPTPNLSSGQYNIHSVTEFACLDEMVEAVEHLIELLSLWSQQKS